MKPAQHTPGPWSQTPEYGSDKEPLFHSIRDSEGNYLASTWPEPHAPNARLMAASPELLSELELLIDAIGDTPCPRQIERIEKSKSIIAKAKGGQS